MIKLLQIEWALGLVMLVNVGHTVSLPEIEQIANTGAVNLSIRILEQEQARLLSQREQWTNWERKRIELYQQTQAWQKILTRLETLPEWVENDFILWASTQRARSLLQMHQAETARRIIRSLIWQTDLSAISEPQLIVWRQIIIDSYLVDGYANDAQMASDRLQLGRKDQDIESLLQRARIAILNQQTRDAVNLLKPFADRIEVAALRLMAQLRGQQREPNEIIEAAYRYLRDETIKAELKVNLWAVVSEAARQDNNHKVVANAIEHILVARQHLSLSKSIYKINSDGLWNAYIDYAQLLANQAHLLIGADEKWLETAEKIAKRKPVGARAMSVFILLRGQTPQVRQRAAELLVALTQKRKQGNQLLLELFQKSQHFKTIQTIPPSVRQILIDVALRNSDIDRASELMATIKAPPEGADQFMWRLRRARILVLGNQAEIGAQAVLSILESDEPLKQEQIDKLLQVVFDLQTAGQHESAYLSFEKALKYIKDEQIQREMFYWMADSRKAQERYTDAARLYLKSALHPDPANMDPWAQTARYQAAESLARAGLYKDAEVLFEHLLRVTKDPARQAALKRELQRLWAMQ